MLSPGPPLLLFIFGLSTFIGIILVIILTWANSNHRHSSRVLGLFLLLMTYYAFHNLSLYSGLMQYYPYLFRTGRPLVYLTAVLVFLYIRSVLYGELRFRRWDFLHFIPALLYALDLIPFYVVSRIEKLNQIELFLQSPNNPSFDARGWLPLQVQHLTIPLILIIYIGLAGRLLYKASKSKITPDIRQNMLVFNWLKLFWSVFLFFFSTWYSVFVLRSLFPEISFLLVQASVAGLMLVIIGVALLFYPSILYGFQGRMPLQVALPVEPKRGLPDETQPNEQGIIFTDEQRLAYRKTLERLMEEERPYLKPGYSLADLATSSGIPYFYLSAIINQEFGLNFNEYINQFRVGYVKQLMEHPEAGQYSLSGLAQMAGFGSRSTFARAFQKVENCSPTEYLKELFKSSQKPKI